MRLFCFFGLLALPLCAALTEAQRVQDFQALAAIYAKSYAPANWKLLAFDLNIFSTSAWLQRVRAAKNDLEHVQILMEYAASFQDTHTQVTMQSNFVADLGFYCDLYDDKVLIDLIDRSLLPQSDFPFAEGDELVSIDGRPALTVARELARLSGWGNPRAALRWAIQGLTLRQQYQYPHAVEVPDISTIVLRRATGETETVRLDWYKSGLPIRDLGIAPSPFASVQVTPLAVEDLADPPTDSPIWRQRFGQRRQSRLPQARRWLYKPTITNAEGLRQPAEAVRGFGRATPLWERPVGFQQRLGRGLNDVFFTGTYQASGHRIGYIRIRDFSFFNNFQLNQLASEVNFMNANTDGLVLDIMRNPGGFDCAVVEAAAMFIPDGFRVGGVSVRPSLSWITDYDAALMESQAFGDPDYVIETLRFQRDLLLAAFVDGRGMTGSIPSCSLDFQDISYPFAYRKPLILLVDDFSTSAADAFASLIQDNRRGPLVGYRTNGAGGNVTSTNTGGWSEMSTTFTESVMLRDIPTETPDFGPTLFIENVGVRPDTTLDYMTAPNLKENGRPFVQQFTRILVEQIRAARPAQ